MVMNSILTKLETFDFFNHVPEHDGDEQVKVVELSNVAFAINI